MFWNQDIGNPIIMWILKTILLLVLYYCGYGISYKKENYFARYAILSIVVYSLIEGLRWNRGVDYWHYYRDIVTNFRFATEEPEFLYKFFCDIIYFSGLPGCIAFVIFSGLFITSFLCVLNSFRKYAVWALPLFYLITVDGAENHIRQFCAIPFFLFAFSYWLRGKKVYMCLMLCIPPFIHKASLFAVLFFVFFTFVRFKMKNRGALYISILYILLALFWKLDYLSGILPYIQMINVGDDGSNFANYTQNADRWFSVDGRISEIAGVTTSVVNIFMTRISAVIALFFGYKVTQKDERLFLPFWFTCISCFIVCIGGDIELFGRFSEWLYYFYPLILSAIIFYVKENSSNFLRYIVPLSLLLIYFAYGFLRYWGTPTLTGSAFVWDA